MSKFKVKSSAKDLGALVKTIPTRMKNMKNGSSEPLPKTYAVNATAKALHPSEQKMKVKDIIAFSEDVKSYVLEMADGSTPAYFRAGQYISVKMTIGNSVTARPYSLASSPNQALAGFYMITVKRVTDGFVSGYILDNWSVGTEVSVSAPEGTFCYEPLRDEKTIVALAGGSGITPFLSMAQAIAEGTEDAELVLIYGCRNEKEILFKKQFDELCKMCNKLKVVYVLSDSVEKGYEHGFITSNIIKKYAPQNYSVFVCGPAGMYEFLVKETEKLGLKKKNVRFELQAGSKPDVKEVKEFSIKVIMHTEEKTVPCVNNESVLVALERAGIEAPSMCRSGECGFCRSKLVSGEVYIPEENDGRRIADLKYGYIHPCCTYPMGDLVIKLN